MLSPHLARLFWTFRSTCRLLREFLDSARVRRVCRTISSAIRCAKRTLATAFAPLARQSCKANGADIAADPIPTGTWSRLPANRPTGAWRPMLPRLFPKVRAVPSPALAPASGFARGLAGPKTVPSSGETETELSIMAIHLERYLRKPKPPPIPSMSGRTARLIGEHLSRHSRTVRLPLAKAFAKHSSNSARTISATSSGSEKSFVFRSFDRQSKSCSVPSDVLRLRPRSESSKYCKADLSTSPRFCGGHGWISQRLIATCSATGAQEPEICCLRSIDARRP